MTLGIAIDQLLVPTSGCLVIAQVVGDLPVPEQDLRGKLLGRQEPIKRVVVHPIRRDEVDERRPNLMIALHQVFGIRHLGLVGHAVVGDQPVNLGIAIRNGIQPFAASSPWRKKVEQYDLPGR